LLSGELLVFALDLGIKSNFPSGSPPWGLSEIGFNVGVAFIFPKVLNHEPCQIGCKHVEEHWQERKLLADNACCLAAVLSNSSAAYASASFVIRERWILRYGVMESFPLLVAAKGMSAIIQRENLE
jgi:hypothetical protein